MIEISQTIQSLKHKISKTFFPKEDHKKIELYINFIRNILERNDLSDSQKKSIITKIIKMLSLNVQNERIEMLFHLVGTHETLEAFSSAQLVLHCPTCNFCTNETCEDINDLQYMFRLNTTPVYSALWDPERMINAFSSIGQIPDKHLTYETNQSSNILIYPIGLVIIGNGYHSATASIYDSDGTLPLHQMINISTFYNAISFDGKAFIHKSCGEIVYTPSCSDIGIIYEIGRLLLNYNLPILARDISIKTHIE